jgi:RimJ/RimL family protein N-acetyltransferase
MSTLPARIETERLVLRRWATDDAQLLKEAIGVSVDHLLAWTPWVLKETEDLTQLTTKLQRHHDKFVKGEEFVYGVFDPAEERVLGAAGLYTRQGPDVLEIGYWLRPDATGLGYATEASAALTRMGLDVPGIRRIEIHCDPINERSAMVPQRLGYRYRETIHGERDGQPLTNMVWERTRDDAQQ